jgi:3-deoxy-D-manno-octulosonic-acid transferase
LLPLWLALWPRFRPGLADRFGSYAAAKLNAVRGARPLWIHAASVGEVLAARALITALKSHLPEHKILLSTFTDTGNQLAQRSGADAVIFLPLDHPLAVRRALRKLDPRLIIVLETELWPNLFRQAARRGIPVLLVSGRLSERALARYMKLRGLFHDALRHLSACGMQSTDDAERLASLGAEPKRILITGNLKQGGEAAAKEEITARPQPPLLVAGSTHAGEEVAILEAFGKLRAQFPGLQLALAPRHPERFAEVEALLEHSGLVYEKKSRCRSLYFEADVLLLDTLGELVQLYARGDVAFVGGSLVPVGGHNMFEPAQLKKPVVFGPHTANVKQLAAALKESGGGFEVRNAAELAGAVERLFRDPLERSHAGERAFASAAAGREGIGPTLQLVLRYLDVPAAARHRKNSSAGAVGHTLAV